MSSKVYAAIAISAWMLCFWLISLRRKDVSIVDIGWGLGFVLVTWTEYFVTAYSGTTSKTDLLIPLLVTAWGVRLSFHLFFRNHGQPEDFRYRQMRSKWGSQFWWISLLTVFALQGIIMWIVSLPLQWSVPSSAASSLTTFMKLLWAVGLAVWLTGLIFETVGDWQLSRFKSRSENKGRVLQYGLWRYTRHPNYFGDALVWWGLFIVSFVHLAPWWTVISPLLMTYLLRRVSGVALLERSLTESKPGYRDYVSRTSAFFPWPPRRTIE